MKTLNRIKGLVLACAVALWACAPNAEPLRVFAAASLQGPLDAVAEMWEGPVSISYGGSGTMARQLAQGAPADAIILANTAWADWLLTQPVDLRESRTLLSNSLVIIGQNGNAPLPDGSADTVLDRLGNGRLAMGHHLSVPAGIYAKGWLDSIGAWNKLQPHLAETENVRAALALVARGETPLGIVYASDAQASDAVDVLYPIPDDAHPKISYPALALTPNGVAFLDHLAAHLDVFVAAGFAAP